ncbi:MAG: GNAT family N-acetyltransferase [Allobaculum sp.]|nr:GNAT family N-acetyltransferase [Allobaculum sp.]
MSLADYEAVYRLWLSCSGMGLNDIDDSKTGIARYLERNPSTCFVALEGDKIVGAILAGHDGRRGYIGHTAVLSAYRHQGIGTQLVSQALEALKQEGITKVNLVVFARNQVGNQFWQNLGFTSREDLVYRNLVLVNMVRIDT